MIHPRQVRSDPFLRSGHTNFILKVTGKFFWAAEKPLLIPELARELGGSADPAEGALASQGGLGTQGRAGFVLFSPSSSLIDLRVWFARAAFPGR